MANRTTNAIGGRAGKGVPHLTNSKLEKYGYTPEQQSAARLAGLKWCGWHKKYEDLDRFDKGCKLCRESAKIRNLELYKKYGNARKYHVPKDWYEKKLDEQGGHCALCPMSVNGRLGTRLSIDHDHYCCPNTKGCCGKCVRGLLCHNCNRMVGVVEMLRRQGQLIANPGTWLACALAYLQQYS